MDFPKGPDEFFGFNNMYAVTQDAIGYPQNQQFIYDYHNSLVSVGRR